MRLLGLILCLAICAGCMTFGSRYQPLPPPAADQSLIYLYRVSAGKFGVPMKVDLGGRFVGFPTQSYSAAYVPAGELSVSATGWQNFHYPESRKFSLRTRVDGGRVYYFRIAQEADGPVEALHWTAVSRAEAERDLLDLRWVGKAAVRE
jgi:hypothetical protein